MCSQPHRESRPRGGTGEDEKAVIFTPTSLTGSRPDGRAVGQDPRRLFAKEALRVLRLGLSRFRHGRSRSGCRVDEEVCREEGPDVGLPGEAVRTDETFFYSGHTS